MKYHRSDSISLTKISHWFQYSDPCYVCTNRTKKIWLTGINTATPHSLPWNGMIVKLSANSGVTCVLSYLDTQNLTVSIAGNNCTEIQWWIQSNLSAGGQNIWLPSGSPKLFIVSFYICSFNVGSTLQEHTRSEVGAKGACPHKQCSKALPSIHPPAPNENVVIQNKR